MNEEASVCFIRGCGHYCDRNCVAFQSDQPFSCIFVEAAYHYVKDKRTATIKVTFPPSPPPPEVVI